jgi:serine O-acetyltransferase
VKLNISIEPGVFEYGLVIPHYGTIVVGGENKIGKYAVLHTSTCITRGGKHIGDALYLSSGAKIVNDVELGNGITISANSLVNKSEIGSNMLLAGCPAVKKKEMIPWYVRDGKEFERRVSEVEALKQSLK